MRSLDVSLICSELRLVIWSCSTGACQKLLFATVPLLVHEHRRISPRPHPTGRLLVAIPAEDDLIEFRGTGRERADRTLETFAPCFRLDDQSKAISAADGEVCSLRSVALLSPAPPAMPLRADFN
jgi:hypothetical protein